MNLQRATLQDLDRLVQADLEDEVEMVYTRTEATNAHVIDLSQKLGYREVRRGAIWDSVQRVSLIKNLQVPTDSW